MPGEKVAVRPADERALVRRVQRDGDMHAFDQLYRANVERVHAFAFRRSGSSAVADDVTQATFEAALRGIGNFRWRGGGFASWLFKIASNELVDHYRRERRERRFAGDRAPDTPQADDAVMRDARHDELRAALDRLRPRYQRAIALRYLADLSHPEAAAAMGVSRGTMAVTLHRALAALRREMERLEADG